MPKSKPHWFKLLDKPTRDRVNAFNANEALRLTYLDIDVARRRDDLAAAQRQRTQAWDRYAAELLGIVPGDVFRDHHVNWLYVGYSPKPDPASSKSQGTPDFFVDMWVLPFEHSTTVQVQFYMPRTLPLAAVRKAEVPEMASLWVQARDPALQIEWITPPVVHVETRVRIPIEIPAYAPRKATKKPR